MKRYWVISPMYEYQDVIDPEIGGPWYPSVDSICIVAQNKREAIKIGVAKLRENNERDGYFRIGWDPATNPYSGFKAEEDYCQHDLEVEKDFGYICDECEVKMSLEYSEKG